MIVIVSLSLPATKFRSILLVIDEISKVSAELEADASTVVIPAAFAKSPNVNELVSLESVIFSSPVIFVKSESITVAASEITNSSVPTAKSILSADVKFALAIVILSSPAPSETVSEPAPRETLSAPAPVLIVTEEVNAEALTITPFVELKLDASRVFVKLSRRTIFCPLKSESLIVSILLIPASFVASLKMTDVVNSIISPVDVPFAPPLIVSELEI